MDCDICANLTILCPALLPKRSKCAPASAASCGLLAGGLPSAASPVCLPACLLACPPACAPACAPARSRSSSEGRLVAGAESRKAKARPGEPPARWMSAA